MKTIIHVNRQIIDRNRKNNDTKAVLTSKNYKGNSYGHEVEIFDENGKVAAKVIYSPDKPLSCGARVWIETLNKVEVINHEI